MDKESLKFFLSWLDVCNDDALLVKRDTIEEILTTSLTPEERSDLRLMLRLIDQERLVRLEIRCSK